MDCLLTVKSDSYRIMWYRRLRTVWFSLFGIPRIRSRDWKLWLGACGRSESADSLLTTVWGRLEDRCRGGELAHAENILKALHWKYNSGILFKAYTDSTSSLKPLGSKTKTNLLQYSLQGLVQELGCCSVSWHVHGSGFKALLDWVWFSGRIQVCWELSLL